MPRPLATLRRRAAKLLDKISEHEIPRLTAVSLALLALYGAVSFAFFTDRFVGLPAFSTVFAFAHPLVWTALYAATGLVLLVGAWRDKDFVQGATLALCTVHVAIGLMTIFPIVGPLEAPPTAFSSYMGPAVFCYINYLMWRQRAKKR
jgi:tryptophan-rich sensory protein